MHCTFVNLICHSAGCFPYGFSSLFWIRLKAPLNISIVSWQCFLGVISSKEQATGDHYGFGIWYQCLMFSKVLLWAHSAGNNGFTSTPPFGVVLLTEEVPLVFWFLHFTSYREGQLLFPWDFLLPIVAPPMRTVWSWALCGWFLFGLARFWKVFFLFGLVCSCVCIHL